MLASLSMESLAGSGYSIGRAVTQAMVAWRPFGIPVTHGTQGSRLYQRHWGSKGLRPQGVMAMSQSSRSRRPG